MSTAHEGLEAERSDSLGDAGSVGDRLVGVVAGEETVGELAHLEVEVVGGVDLGTLQVLGAVGLGGVLVDEVGDYEKNLHQGVHVTGVA